MPTVSYSKLIFSLGTLLKQTPALRRRALYQACLFGAFSLFWTVVPLRLADDFGMSQQGIALFALVGVGGAVAAPIAGRLADKGWSKGLTGLAMIIAALSFCSSIFFKVIRPLRSYFSLFQRLHWIWLYRETLYLDNV